MWRPETTVRTVYRTSLQYRRGIYSYEYRYNCLEIATKKCPGRGMCVPYYRTVRIFLHSRAITSQEIILVRFMI